MPAVTKDPQLLLVPVDGQVVVSPYIRTIPPAAFDALGTALQRQGAVESGAVGVTRQGQWLMQQPDGAMSPRRRAAGARLGHPPGTFRTMIRTHGQAVYGFASQACTQFVQQLPAGGVHVGLTGEQVSLARGKLLQIPADQCQCLDPAGQDHLLQTLPQQPAPVFGIAGRRAEFKGYRERAAILLMTVGEEGASEVFKYLTPKEVQKVGESMAKLSTVSRERIEDIIKKFHAAREDNISLVRDTDDYVTQVLRKGKWVRGASSASTAQGIWGAK